MPSVEWLIFNHQTVNYEKGRGWGGFGRSSLPGAEKILFPDFQASLGGTSIVSPEAEALRSMPGLRVVADHREFGSGVPEALRLRQDAVVVASALASADYVIDETIGVERKTGSDFAKSLFDGRLFRQVSALKRSYERPLLLLEGLVSGQETAGVAWAALRGAMISVTAVFGVPIIFSSGPEESAELVAIAARQISAAANDDSYVRPGYRPKGWKKRALYLLQGLPGVGPKRASALLAACGSVRGVFSADEATLAAVPGLGRSVAGAIVKAVGEEEGGEAAD